VKRRPRVFTKYETVWTVVPCRNCQATGVIHDPRLVQAVTCRECNGMGVVKVQRRVKRRCVR